MRYGYILKQRRRKKGYKTPVIDGVKFHSGEEGGRYQVLKNKKGVSNLLTQEPQVIVLVNNCLITKYKFDFSYEEKGILWAEEYKGHWRPDAKIRFKLALATLQKESPDVCVRVCTKNKQFDGVRIDEKGKLVYFDTLLNKEKRFAFT
jgi:hypothetical protein